MDLLAAHYASSSSDGDHEGDDAQQQQQNSEDTAAREAIARRFAARAKSATRNGGTAAERHFKYKPYEPKRSIARPRAASDGREQDATSKPPITADRPLFAELARLATASCRPRACGKTALPRLQKSARFDGHRGAVACLQWNPRYPPLFLSASMDSSVCVWSLPRSYYDNNSDGTVSSSNCRRLLEHHSSGVKSAKWSVDGQHVWSGDFGGHAVYVDVERSRVVCRYDQLPKEQVTAVCRHPTDPQLALLGTSRGRILQWDLRLSGRNVATAYDTKTTGEIHDVLFLPDEGGDQRFVSTTALSARDTSHRTMAVWDCRSTAMLADHLHSDLCAFTSLRLHPNGKHFAGQSSESEVVLFSTRAPYKRLKPKLSYSKGHDAEGYSVGFSFNASGSLLATGDINGRVVLYCGKTQRVLRQISAFSATSPCLAAEFHPQWASTLVVSGYDGRIRLLDAWQEDALS